MSDRIVLPSALKPLHYGLRLYDLDLEKLTYKGTVSIDLDVKETTSKLVLNYRTGLRIDSGSVGAATVTGIEYSEEREEVSLSLSEPLVAGSKATATIEFEADVQTNMSGFYRSQYQENGEDKFMLSTQFESTDARRAFPCMDEPNLKASFEFEITVPQDWTALSNMPVASETVSGGRKTVKFDRSPIMSTYLFAWACGEFEYIEAFTEKEYNGKPLPVRVYTTKGLKKQGELALQSACKILDYFSRVFDIDYVLPKCDLLAVHEFTHGAMENWGLITYRTTAVLFDPETSEDSYKIRVVYVVAHELAHQWFGDLVTMDWWEELWLNEGFATWVGWLAVDHLYPEWDVFSRFVNEALQQALALDSLRGSHPIEVPVKSGAEIDQIFDHISYLKGASCIRMISTHMGVDKFLKGVSNYLKKHAFGNARTVDLWGALAEVAGEPIGELMHNWTRTIGFPVLTVEEQGSGIKVRQDRFLSSGGVTEEENQTIWWVPLELTTDGNEVTHYSLREKETQLASSEFFKFNRDQVGVYRVNYSVERLAKMGSHIDKLTVKDKIGLVGDAGATAQAGIASTDGLLTLVKKIGESGEDSYFVWTELVARLQALQAAWSEYPVEEVRKGLDQFAVKLVTPLLSKFSWDTKGDEDFIWIQFRALIFSFAIDLGIESVVSEAKARFTKFLAGDVKALHPSLKRYAVCAAIKYSTGEELTTAYNYVKKELADSKTVDGREQAAIAAGKVQNPQLIQESLSIFLNGGVVPQDAHSLISTLASNTASRQTTWKFVKENWEAISKQYKSNFIIFERIVRLVLTSLSTKQDHDDVKAFFEGKDLTGYDRGVSQALDVIKVRYQWVEKDSSIVQQWLSSN